jgi:hypothetical protein
VPVSTERTVEDAALEYAAAGWPVFPIAPRSKVPPKGSRGVYEATVDCERIRAMWRRVPGANVGLRCGLAFDVLDVDAHHGGFDTLAELVGGDDVLVACVPCARTPNGGAHLFYAVAGYGNRADIARGLDFRGDGGYVVGVPSTTRDGPYAWHVQDGETFDAGRPLVPLPKWLRELVARAEPERAPVPEEPSVQRVGQSNARGPAYVRAAVEREAHAVSVASVGTRNDRLNRAAFSLARLCADGLDPDVIRRTLTSAAQDAGLSASEAAATIDSGLSARGVAA